MSFDLPSGPVAGEPDDCGDSETVTMQEAVIEAAYEVGLLQYVMPRPVIGIGF
jgi:hypothetical protein